MRDSRQLTSRAARLVIDRGLISAEDVLRYGIRARDVSASNGVALVEAGNGRGFAVKDMRPRPDAQQGTADRERRLYEAAAGSELTRFLPGYFPEDEDSEIMVLEGLSTSRRLDQVAGGQGVLDPDLAAALGAALGQWHVGSRSLGGLDDAEPWVLQIDGSGRLGVLDSDETLRKLTERILEDRTLCAQIDRVRSVWTADAVIHGDMRFANVMVCMSPRALRFIDWETSGWGDSRWDVAGVIQEFLSVGLNQGYGLGDSSAAPLVRAMIAAYEESSGKAVVWSELAPFLSCRTIMRSIQLANWSEAKEAVVDQHLDLARELSSVDDDPFDADPAAIIRG